MIEAAMLLSLAGCRTAATNRPVASPAAGFTDITREAGITFRHVNGMAGKFYYPETFGSGVALFDYDRDGWLDILLVNGDTFPGETPPGGQHPTLALYHNNRNGTFTDVTAATGLDVSLYGMGVAVGDYDNDGYDDVYITGLDHSLLFHNEGGARFRDVTAGAGVGNAGHWGTSVAWLDYDNDGRLDLFVCNHIHWSTETEQVCRQGDRRIYCGPLVYNADSCRLFHNEGGGRFRDVTRAAGVEKAVGKSLGVAIWDVDGDRYPDILVANDLSTNYLFHNRRDGTFEEMGITAGIAYGADGMARSGMGIDVADTRNDGTAQVLVSNFAREPNSFFVQESPGALLFQDRTYETGMGEPSLLSLGFGLVFLDYDNDGFKDAFITNGHVQPEIALYEAPETFAQRPLLFHNRGDGVFDEVSAKMGPAFQTALVGRGAACGDIDNDGDLDLIHTGNGGSPQLLRNDMGNRHAWLQIRLIGTRSNRDGIGAEVRLRVGQRRLRDQVRSGSSYLSASDPRLHVGLGDAASVDEIEVRWPSGAVDRLQNVKANQILTLTEGQSKAGSGKAAGS
jgi:hypothetical protein